MKYLNSLSKKITTLDFVGYKPKLLYRGNENTQFFLGGIISIIVVGFLSSFTLYFIIQLFSRSNFNITTNNEINFNPAYNMSKIPFIFKLVNGNIKDIPNDTSIYQWETLYSSSNLGYYYFYLQPCDINNPNHFGDYREYFKNVVNISSYNCINDLNKYNLNLYGLYSSTTIPSSTINFMLNFCFNSTKSKLICRSREYMNELLGSVYINLVYLDYTVDHQNINTPGNVVLQTQILQVSSTIYKRYNMFKGLIQYETDYGFVFPEVKTQTFFQLKSTEVVVDLRVQIASNKKFAHICFMMSQEGIRYSRRYSKVQEVIASIGGVLSAILFAARLLISYISKKIFLIRLANDSYVHKSKDKKKLILSSILAKNEKNETNPPDVPDEGNNVNISPSKLPFQRINLDTDFIYSSTTEKKPEKDNQLISSVNNYQLEIVDSKDSSNFVKKQDQNIKKNAETKKHHPHKYNFENSIDDDGKIKICMKNIFWPSPGVKKVYEIMEKKSGIDEMLKYCSQVEKIKKYMFHSDDELNLFNNLPDLDMMEILPDLTKDQQIDLKKSITTMLEQKPDAKILKTLEKF